MIKMPSGSGGNRGRLGCRVFEIDFREILTLAMIFIPLERLLPQRPGQRVLRKQWLNDVFYLVGNGIVIRLGMLAIFAGLMVVAPFRPPAGGAGFIGSLPLWAEVILAIIIADIGFYAHHRLFHAVPFLWRFHAVHHSIEELDWLAAHRVHPFDQIVSSSFMMLPLYFLGFSAEAMVILGLIYLLTSHLVHANVALDFGPLRYVFASPHFHHWHHSNVPGTHDTNFSGQLVFMDLLLGTFRLPGAYPERYGTDDPVPEIYPLQLAWPLLREHRDGAAAPSAPRTEPEAS